MTLSAEYSTAQEEEGGGEDTIAQWTRARPPPSSRDTMRPAPLDTVFGGQDDDREEVNARRVLFAHSLSVRLKRGLIIVTRAHGRQNNSRSV